MSMVGTVAIALSSLAGLTGVGFLLDAGLRLFPGVPRTVRWPLRALTAIVALYLASVWVPLAAVAVALAIGRAVWRPRASVAPETGHDRDRVARAMVVVLLAWLALAMARPPSPLYWDEFVWATKAAIEARGGWGALRAAALSGGSDVFPAGYPLLWSLAPAWLVRDEALAALTVAFLIVKLLVVACCAAIAAAETSQRRETLAGAAVVAAAPLVFVHAGAFYGDLSVGLLSAALLVTLLRADERRWPHAVPITLAIALVGCKDEGLAHVAVTAISAVAASSFARGGRPSVSCVRQAAATATAAIVVFATWRIVLAAAGVTDLDHRVSPPRLSGLPQVALAGLRDAVDPRSWGALWPACAAAIGVTAWTLRSRATARDHVFALAFAVAPVAHVVVLTLAFVCGSDRMRAFALGGTMTNRWLIQVAPTAALAIAGALVVRRRPERRGPLAEPHAVRASEPSA